MNMFEISSSEVIGALIGFGIIQWLTTRWMQVRLEESIRHEYSKKIEDYKHQQLQKQKAETVARLFSLWKKYQGKESKYLSDKELLDYYEELGRMSTEVALWLPDDNLLIDIMKRLQVTSDAKDVRSLVGEVRSLIFGSKSDFHPQELVLWENKVTEIVNKKMHCCLR